MSLDKSIKEMKFDARLLQYNLATGQITKEDVQKHLDNLPDLSNQCESLELESKRERPLNSH